MSGQLQDPTVLIPWWQLMVSIA